MWEDGGITFGEAKKLAEAGGPFGRCVSPPSNSLHVVWHAWHTCSAGKNTSGGGGAAPEIGSSIAREKRS